MDRKRQLPGRELIGAILLAVLLLTGLGVSAYMGEQQEETAALLEDAAWEGLCRDWDAAGSLLENARSRWQKDWKLAAVTGDHSPLEEIDALFSQLRIYAAQRESGEFAAACRALATHIF